MKPLTTSLSAAVLVILAVVPVGCVAPVPVPAGAVYVGGDGYRHDGYYDDQHRWHGGYYDEHHLRHDDPPDWHH